METALERKEIKRQKSTNDSQQLTVFVLVPNFDKSIAFPGSRKKCSVRTESHVMNWRCCVALPDTLPSLFLSFVLLVCRRFWIAAADFKFHWNLNEINLKFLEIQNFSHRSQVLELRQRPFHATSPAQFHLSRVACLPDSTTTS